MKFLSISYGGLDDCFTRVSMVIEHGNRNYRGAMLVENDGRDVDFEGGLIELSDSEDIMLELLESDQLEQFEKVYSQGYKEYEK